MNPRPTDPTAPEEDRDGYLLPKSGGQQIEPPAQNDAAVTMLRRKLDAIYMDEPSAKQEMKVIEKMHPPRSKHQEVMHKLTMSGKSMAEIQEAWHKYYEGLSDHEKHQVWQEFYEANAQRRAQHKQLSQAKHESKDHKPAPAKHQPVVAIHEEPDAARAQAKKDRRSTEAIKKQLLKRVKLTGQLSHNTRSKARDHLKSLAFGLGVGSLAILITLFGLFNEMVIAPFIRPGSAAATPIILDANAPAPNDKSEVIIPKINAQLPVVYGSQSIAEDDVQKALEDGVFHYPTTADPGQDGNVAIFGHSSNNIFNQGKYKFAFVLLRELEPGDIFYLTHEGTVYTYKVYSKRVVNPDETWVLGPVEGKQATAALITCDPPGSTRKRLVVWGEQINPDPGGNRAAAEPSQDIQTQELPDKGPPAWSSLWSWINPFD